MAQTYTGNPDSSGMSWEGPIRLGSLLVRPWLSNLRYAGGNVTGMKYSVDDGTVYINKQFDDFGLDSDVYRSCATNVSMTTTGERVPLTQLDYIVHTTDPSVIWSGLAELDQEQMIHSNIQMSPTGLLQMYIQDMLEMDDQGNVMITSADTSGNTALTKGGSQDTCADFEEPSAGNDNGRQTCYAGRDWCANVQKGYKVATGLAYVSGINWMAAWSHHSCQSKCSDNFHVYSAVYHKNKRYSVRLGNCRNLYSAAMATQRPGIGINWGVRKSQGTCGPWNGNLPACDRMPIGAC